MNQVYLLYVTLTIPIIMRNMFHNFIIILLFCISVVIIKQINSMSTNSSCYYEVPIISMINSSVIITCIYIMIDKPSYLVYKYDN